MRRIQLAILAADDLVRQGLCMIVQHGQRNIHVIGTYAHLSDYQEDLKADEAHILLLDDAVLSYASPMLLMPRLLADCPRLKVIILSELLSERYIQQLVNCGAKGFIYKRDHLEDVLVGGVKTVHDGHLYLSPQVSALHYDKPGVYELNATDLQVLRLTALGLTAQEIATHLKLVSRSIYRIRGKLRDHLGIRTNEQMIEAARKKGLLNSD